MKRIAAPMIGGVVTSAILELLLYPAIYMLWRRHHLPNPRGTEFLAAAKPARRPWGRLALLLAVVAIGAGGYLAWQHRAPAPANTLGLPFATRTADGITVNLYAPGGLHFADNEVTVEFLDTATGRPVDVGTVKFDLDMNMPGMVMHSGSTITATGEPGRYRAKIKPEMAGDWTAKLDYDGPRGRGALSFTATVAQ